MPWMAHIIYGRRFILSLRHLAGTCCRTRRLNRARRPIIVKPRLITALNDEITSNNCHIVNSLYLVPTPVPTPVLLRHESQAMHPCTLCCHRKRRHTPLLSRRLLFGNGHFLPPHSARPGILLVHDGWSKPGSDRWYTGRGVHGMVRRTSDHKGMHYINRER